MRCPGCNNLENKVVDSRLTKDGHIIRRRRECLDCNSRFTTYERIEELLPLVIKKDNRREPFDRMKILSGVQKACEKRPVSVEKREQLVDRVIKTVQECGDKEIQSELIGENLMKELYSLDKIAYVRFASVYRSFKDINEFMSELKDLLKDKKTNLDL